MPPIYLTSDLLSYKRKPNLFNPARKSISNDPFLGNVLLHLKFDGSISDSSLNNIQGTNTNVSFSGDSKYGNSSGLFLQENTFCSFPITSIGSDDYTIEAWVKTANPDSNSGLVSLSTTNTPSLSTAGGVYLATRYQGFFNPLNSNNDAFSTASLTSWSHVAMTRNGVTGKVWLNGIEQFSFSDSNNYTQSYLIVGAYYSSLYCWNGLIDSFRLSNIARYTANFDPELDTYLAY